MYLRSMRRFGDFRNPQSFSEKINWRIINDRRDILKGTCDKLWMQEYAANAGVKTPRQIWNGENLEELVDIDLPDRWVLKPNNSSGQVYFGQGNANLSEIVASAEIWRRNPTSKAYPDEWAYSQAREGYLVESMIGVSGQDLPDYKFFVFNGIPELIQVDSTRFNGHQRRLYTTDWVPLDVQNVRPLGPNAEKPNTLDEMLEVASILGQPFDFIRVDLYDVDGDVYFGEITPYPGGGLEPYSPSELDQQLGMKWELPKVES